MKNSQSKNKVIQVNDTNIGINIATIRKEKNIKQTELVAKLQIKGIDISVYSLNRIEKGSQNPTVSFLLACCDIFECDMNTLFQTV